MTFGKKCMVCFLISLICPYLAFISVNDKVLGSIRIAA